MKNCFIKDLMINVVQVGFNTFKNLFCLFICFKPSGAVQIMKASDSLGDELKERPVVSRKPSSGDYYRHISETQRDLDSFKVNLINTSDLSFLVLYESMSCFLWSCAKLI